jgi:hypothetical protein
MGHKPNYKQANKRLAFIYHLNCKSNTSSSFYHHPFHLFIMLTKVLSGVSPNLKAFAVQASLAGVVFTIWRNSAGKLAHADMEARQQLTQSILKK